MEVDISSWQDEVPHAGGGCAMEIEMRPDMAPGWVTGPSTDSAPSTPTCTTLSSPSSPSCGRRGRHQLNRLQDIAESRRSPPPRPRLTQGCWSRSLRWSPSNATGGQQTGGQQASPNREIAPSGPIGGLDLDLSTSTGPVYPPRGVKRERAMSDEGDDDYTERQEEGRGHWKLSFEQSQNAKDNDTHRDDMPGSDAHPGQSISPSSAAAAQDYDTLAKVVFGIGEEEAFEWAYEGKPTSEPRGDKRKRANADDGTKEYHERRTALWSRLVLSTREDSVKALAQAHEEADTAKPKATQEHEISAVTAREEPTEEEPAEEAVTAPVGEATDEQGRADSSCEGDKNVVFDHDQENEETALPTAESRRKKVFYYDLEYAGGMLQYLLYSSLPTLIADVKHPKSNRREKAAAVRTAHQWLNKTGLSDLSHEFMEVIWEGFAPADSDDEGYEDVEYDEDPLEIGPYELGMVLDRIFEQMIRPLLAPRPELEGLSQSLTSAQQRTLRTQFKSARSDYMKRHDGNEAENDDD